MLAVYLLMAIVGAAAAIFALQNIDPVVIRFLTWRMEGAPLSMVIMLSIVVGVILASLVGFVRHWKLRARIRQLENRLARLPAAEPPRNDEPTPTRQT
jgi:uncharacterized integral membrane protein